MAVGFGSAVAGASLALLFGSPTLQQAELSPEETRLVGGDRIVTGGYFGLPRLTQPVNIMVMGIKMLALDEQEGFQKRVNTFDGLADTILIARFEPDTRQVRALSIPRDTRVNIPGHGWSKINATNVWGGPALTAHTLDMLLGGVEVDRYVRVNPMAVEALVDALGGITLTVPEDMRYQDDSQHLYINLKAGRQRLNGKQAMAFLLFRYDRLGDIGRIQRQQLFMRAFREEVLTPATLARLPQLLSAIQTYVDTNLTVEEIVALAGLVKEVQSDSFQMTLLPGQFSGQEYSASYWLPDETRVQTVAAQFFQARPAAALSEGEGETPPSLAQLRIAIQDSTDNPEAVAAVTDHLLGAGYRRIYEDVPWKVTLRQTQIIAQQGNLAAAQQLQGILGFGAVRVESTGELYSDLTIQVGQDWKYGLKAVTSSAQTGERP
ncbi:MAG: LCP family protein [Gloeomargaritaceae cyanobacterium C42_A2020_066]|nr:LCP family protein [Gloeomargaritaceae cyanobacterium C42_A2020_066]